MEFLLNHLQITTKSIEHSARNCSRGLELSATMKSSTLMVILLVLHAVLVMGIFAAVAKENAVGESKGNRETNGGKLRCCSSCNFSFSGLYTCDDVVKKCDPVCKKCTAVRGSKAKHNPSKPKKLFQCTDTFLGVCGPPCKN
ncbi:Bowman-Birk type wound-induced proteinase inhibitor WIP1 isoform X2 [Brachypodium distachyon]|uniref:Bowman-Birk serine protease inhibitors family domain-containing protein n=1 Tax=Brachypodium distachyon TaxID=15368 RepID=I1HDX7_BRADI|nr:Bowman-Birk type wound-induced proteinase inhibitor WIP1 isoform X2 [Brachypodium distachyon]KQK03610.1 hypothetical protein BRADI_2g08870v3 [Brachypodium distachyon]PNT70266.1 hypothetical protein BRADI_2g08870v3 [Brachypodium distachyon]|eukprot:XP_014754343.1 Bowman-Birk type wound-induced proteinase inhibitor WIP1 isoform X2 [Brachypodium distachyon]